MRMHLFMFLLALLVGKVLADVSTVIDALAEGNRSILLAALLSSRFVLIVSGTDSANDLKFAQVFDQKAETLTSDKIYLQNAVTLENTWSALVSLSGNLVAVLDAEGTSFIVSCHSQNCSIIINNINIDVHPKRMPSFTDHYEHDIANDVLISSNQNGIFYDISAKSNLSKITFNSSSKNKLHHEKMSHICKGSTSESVVVQTDPCKNAMGWQLTSGFIACDTVFLFNKSAVVFAFPQRALTIAGKEVPLKMMQTRDFFVPGNPPKQSLLWWIIGIACAVVLVLATIALVVYRIYRKKARKKGFKHKTSKRSRRSSSRKRSSTRCGSSTKLDGHHASKRVRAQRSSNRRSPTNLKPSRNSDLNRYSKHGDSRGQPAKEHGKLVLLMANSTEVINMGINKPATPKHK